MPTDTNGDGQRMVTESYCFAPGTHGQKLRVGDNLLNVPKSPPVSAGVSASSASWFVGEEAEPCRGRAGKTLDPELGLGGTHSCTLEQQ